MKPSTRSRARRARSMSPSRRFIIIGFSCAAALFVCSTISAVVETHRLQEHAREIVDNMLTSIQLLGRLDAEVERRRILIDDHIFAKDASEMDELDSEITTLNGQIAETMRAYDRWATLPGERVVWQRARADLDRLNAPLDRALRLSRLNRDAEARDMMGRVTAGFARLDQDLDDLVGINNRGAMDDLTRFSMVRARLTFMLIAIGLIALAGTVIVAVWASRQVGRREDDLARTAALLEERNRELDAFAGRVAHDIRGPLTAITLAMRPIEQKLPEGDRAFQILRRGAKTMGALIDDLLALARSNAAAEGWCDPADIARAVEEELGPRVDAERGELRVAVARAGVTCSEGLLRQAVVNLVENAIKYRRPEAPPVVHIAGAPRDGVYELGVTDNGVGMSAEEARHATEPFYRSPRARELPGTGLGLSIVARVAKACGGRLTISSAPGAGSTFMLHLPVATEPRPSDDEGLSRSSGAARSPRAPTSTGPR